MSRIARAALAVPIALASCTSTERLSFDFPPTGLSTGTEILIGAPPSPSSAQVIELGGTFRFTIDAEQDVRLEAMIYEGSAADYGIELGTREEPFTRGPFLEPRDVFTMRISEGGASPWMASALSTELARFRVPAPQVSRLGTGLPENHACLVRAHGIVECWGLGEHGETTHAGVVTKPTAVAGIRGAIDVSMGLFHTCVLLRDETVVCFGDNSRGQLGRDPLLFDSSSTPLPVPDVGEVVQLRSGTARTCALRRNGDVWCWGDWSDPGCATRAPSRVDGFPGPVEKIDVGTRNVCGVVAGELFCAGLGGLCSLFVPGRSGCFADAIRIESGSSSPVRDVALGDNHECVLLEDGELRCWGCNGVGQADPATGGVGAATESPVSILREVRAVDLGWNFSCAIADAESRVSCWGANDYGQLGDDGPPGQPVRVASLRDPAEVQAYWAWTCARWSDGDVYCWGNGEHGELGTGTTTGSRAPVRWPR